MSALTPSQLLSLLGQAVAMRIGLPQNVDMHFEIAYEVSSVTVRVPHPVSEELDGHPEKGNEPEDIEGTGITLNDALENLVSAYERAASEIPVFRTFDPVVRRKHFRQ